MAVSSQIVTVQANVVSAPTPPTLQQSGAFISVGATTPLVTNALTFCPTLADVTTLTGSGGNHIELGQMATTFFAQSSASESPIGAYVLELGNQSTPAAAITALDTWIAANPKTIYAFLTPATWDTTTSTNLNTVASHYSSTVGETYIFGTTTQGRLANYSAANKALFMTVPSSGAGTEFQAAGSFYDWLVNNPGIANPAAPMAFRYQFGVTPWALPNNQAAIDAILTGFGNIVTSGAEGGISTSILRNGTTIDGNQAMFWYDVDWVLINSRLRLANAVINGSNSNPPLYYNQNGINTLLDVLVNLGRDAVEFGLAQAISFDAVSFADYTKANPGDYAKGIYKGFKCTMTPQLGFTSITFYLTATSFTG